MCLWFNIFCICFHRTLFSICFHRTLCSHHSQITSACFMLTKWQSSSSSIFYNRGCYFQAGRSLKLGTSIDAGFRMALETWASWVEKRVDLNRTHVFFRTYEPSHWGYVIYNKLRLWKIIMVVRHLNLIKKKILIFNPKKLTSPMYLDNLDSHVIFSPIKWYTAMPLFIYVNW